MSKHYVNLGIAVAGHVGLIVPNVKEAQDLSLGSWPPRWGPHRTRPLRPLHASTTYAAARSPITNVGVFGVDAGVPILNPGEAAILAVGALQRRPWELRGRGRPAPPRDA